MKFNLKNRPKRLKDTDPIYWVDVEKWFEGFEAEFRLFISIHENEGHKIDPKLARKEILGE